MKILQLCHKPPFPPNDGGTKAMHANTIALQKLGHEVHVLTIETPKHPVLWADLEGDYIHTTDFTAYFENTTPSRYDAFQAFLFKENYHLERFNIPEFHALVQKKLADVEYDVVWLESLYVACYIETVRNASAIPIILRAHNVEYQLWDHRLEEYTFPSSLFIKTFNKQLKQTEKEVFKKVDAIAAISDKDALLIKPDANSTPLYTLPYFVEERSSNTNNKSFTFGYIGALDWEPNIQGVLWLANEVWPTVKLELPDAELHIAGRNMDQRITEIQQNGVIVHGEVDNSDDFIQSAQILTVPLFSSSGIRIKLIEAFASKKAVVASSAATDGLNQGVDKASLIADSSSQFAQGMIHLATNESAQHHLEQQAFDFYQSNYSEQLYLQRLTDLMKEVVS